MNNLTVFNTDVIPVYETTEGKKVVIGRELHEKLGINTAYKDWFPRMCEYGFSEETDYGSFLSDRSDGLAGKPKTNHIMSLDMAKHIAMMQRSESGFAIRQKLIDLEDTVSDLSPELRLLINMERQQRAQEKRLAEVEETVQATRDIIALNPNSWRSDATKMIVRIAQKMGGNEYISTVHSEIYKLLDERFKVNLSVRLTNMRRRMAEEGISKSKRDKANRLDVIAEDKKLIEGFLIIVKEMAIKYGVTEVA